MKKILYGMSALMLGACATTSDQSSMSPAELADCLQPNRRVVVDINGRVVKPPAKKPAPQPQEAAAAQTAAPAPKPEKPQFAPFQQAAYVQGNTAFDPGSAVLKDGGKAELDQLAALLQKRAVQVGAVIISGHTDRLEADAGNKSLAEERAKAVKDYLTSKGMDEKLMFWEGKGATDPVAVTKFCT